MNKAEENGLFRLFCFLPTEKTIQLPTRLSSYPQFGSTYPPPVK